jgi:multicomponent K+:H+ antiporter subunit D
VAVLVLLCVGLAVLAAPVLGYLESAAASIHAPQGYMLAVLGPAPAPGGAP